MTDSSLDDLARRLEELPREAWDRPVPPPAPWPAEERRVSFGRRLVLRPVVAFACSAALIAAGIAGGLAISGGDEDGSSGGAPKKVELNPVTAGDSAATGSAELRADGDATVRLAGLQPNTGEDFYELWLLGEDGELVSLGSFRVPESGEAELDVPVPVDPAGFRYLDVSREPADGDPSHSTDSVLRGPTA